MHKASLFHEEAHFVWYYIEAADGIIIVSVESSSLLPRWYCTHFISYKPGVLFPGGQKANRIARDVTPQMIRIGSSTSIRHKWVKLYCSP